MLVYVHCNPITHFDAWGLSDEKEKLDKAITAYGKTKTKFDAANKTYNEKAAAEKENRAAYDEAEKKYKLHNSEGNKQARDRAYNAWDKSNSELETAASNRNKASQELLGRGVNLFEAAANFAKSKNKEQASRNRVKDNSRTGIMVNKTLKNPSMILYYSGMNVGMVAPPTVDEARGYAASVPFIVSPQTAIGATGALIEYAGECYGRGEMPTSKGIAGVSLVGGIMGSSEKIETPFKVAKGLVNGFFGAYVKGLFQR